MISQTRKNTAFLRWSGLEANMDHMGKNKTAVTSLVHDRLGGPHTQPVISGKAVPRLKPPEAHKYLGQVMALKPSRKAQSAPLLSKITGICQQIVQAVGTPGLKIRKVEQVLRPTARYTMPLGPFTFRVINQLNSQVYMAVKRSFGLSKPHIS